MYPPFSSSQVMAPPTILSQQHSRHQQSSPPTSTSSSSSEPRPLVTKCRHLEATNTQPPLKRSHANSNENTQMLMSHEQHSLGANGHSRSSSTSSLDVDEMLLCITTGDEHARGGIPNGSELPASIQHIITSISSY